MSRIFTVAEARGTLAQLRPALDDFVRLRADAAEINAAVQAGDSSPLGGRAELKAAEARCNDILAAVQAAGVEVKGFAPLLLDLPAELDGLPVLLCWLEGDAEVAWYHRRDLGFLGRRPLAS